MRFVDVVVDAFTEVAEPSVFSRFSNLRLSSFGLGLSLLFVSLLVPVSLFVLVFAGGGVGGAGGGCGVDVCVGFGVDYVGVL